MRSLSVAFIAIAAIGAAQASEVIAVPVSGAWGLLPGRLSIPNETLPEFAARHKAVYNGHWKGRAISTTEYWEAGQPIVPIPDAVRAELPPEILALLDPESELLFLDFESPDIGVQFPISLTFADHDIEGNQYVLNPANYEISGGELGVLRVEPVDNHRVKVWLRKFIPKADYKIAIKMPPKPAAPVEPEEVEADDETEGEER